MVLGLIESEGVFSKIVSGRAPRFTAGYYSFYASVGSLALLQSAED